MKNIGLILWNAMAICEVFKTTPGRWEKTPCERRIGEPFKSPVIPFGAMVEYYPISARDQSWLHQCCKNVLTGQFLRFALIVGGIWKGDTLIANFEELEKIDASDLYPRRINAKEVLIQKRRRIHIPRSRWYSKIVRRDCEFREPTPRRD